MEGPVYEQAFPQLTETDRDAVDLPVRVRARAGQTRVRIDYDAERAPYLRVDTTAPPEKGKANAAVCKLLARELGVPKSALHIIKGASAPDKVIRVRC